MTTDRFRAMSRCAATLADELGRTRGVICDPSQILVVQGTTQGVDLALRVLRDRGATRSPSKTRRCDDSTTRSAGSGSSLVGQPVDDEGLIVDGLDADVVIVSPAHQFPTGAVLSGARRRALLNWSRDTGGLVIEDDYDAEFRYDREPVRALQGLHPEGVIYVGTVSKTLAPALRLGWLVLPEPLVAAADGDQAAARRLLTDARAARASRGCSSAATTSAKSARPAPSTAPDATGSQPRSPSTSRN